jgi:hypothetical protein
MKMANRAMSEHAGRLAAAAASTALLALALPAVAAMAPSEANLPSARTYYGVEYVTGGVGEKEAKAFQRSESRYPLAIEIVEKSAKHDEFTADAHVKIADAKGHTVLDAKADGPFMLVQLAPGKYRIDATLKDKTVQGKWVEVTKGHTSRELLEFPAHTD